MINMTIDLKSLPKSQKLMLMEDLWRDLSASDDVESPPWHEEELIKTEADYAAGKVESLDWEDSKKQLRSMFE